MCLVPMVRLMASSMRLYSVRRWVPLANQVYIQVQQQARATSKITGSAWLNEEMEQRRRSRGPPSHSLSSALYVPIRRIRTIICSGRSFRALRYPSLHRFYLVQFHCILHCRILNPSLFRRFPSMHLFPFSPASPPLQVLFTCVRCQLPACAGPCFSLIIAISAPQLAPVADCADRPVRCRVQRGMERRREPVSITSPLLASAVLCAPSRCYSTESIRPADLESDSRPLHACEHFSRPAMLGVTLSLHAEGPLHMGWEDYRSTYCWSSYAHLTCPNYTNRRSRTENAWSR
jgi:hypothetical protein